MHRDKPSEFVEAGTNLLTGVHKNEKKFVEEESSGKLDGLWACPIRSGAF